MRRPGWVGRCRLGDLPAVRSTTVCVLSGYYVGRDIPDRSSRDQAVRPARSGRWYRPFPVFLRSSSVAGAFAAPCLRRTPCRKGECLCRVERRYQAIADDPCYGNRYIGSSRGSPTRMGLSAPPLLYHFPYGSFRAEMPSQIYQMDRICTIHFLG
jgi:hypothetical protein